MVKSNLIPLVAVALAVIPLAAFAQNPQAAPGLQQIQQQQSKVDQIEADAVAEIEELLTPEQLNQYKRARRRGAGMIQGLDEIQNLSDKQQSQINRIIRNTSRRILDSLPRSPR